MATVRPNRADLARIALVAAAFAAAELVLALTLGRFFAWGRAENLIFLAFRPWLLLVLAWFVASWGWRARAAAFAAALAAAGAAESLFLEALGGEPWAGILRGWAAGAAAALVLDLLVQLGRRLGGGKGRAGAALLAGLLLLVPGASRPYERLAIGPAGTRTAAERPELLVMTGLPLVWGETGPFDPASLPAAVWPALNAEFDARAIDYLDAESLGRSRLLLLAQPRLLEPAELAALDSWVRGGGRVLILADPRLVWPTRLALGDPRRPPPTSLLSPLLGHWGLRLEPADEEGLVLRDVAAGGGAVRRLALAAPGRFAATGEECTLALDGLAASCRIGRGAALLVADADLLHDRLWAAAGPNGTERHRRLSDNPLLVADWLDRLGGIRRERAAGRARWLAADSNRGRALLAAAIPLLALLGIAMHSLIHSRHWQEQE